MLSAALEAPRSRRWLPGGFTEPLPRHIARPGTSPATPPPRPRGLPRHAGATARSGRGGAEAARCPAQLGRACCVELGCPLAAAERAAALRHGGGGCPTRGGGTATLRANPAAQTAVSLRKALFRLIFFSFILIPFFFSSALRGFLPPVDVKRLRRPRLGGEAVAGQGEAAPGAARPRAGASSRSPRKAQANVSTAGFCKII